MRKEEGVSPVIGTILMVAVTIVLVAALYTFVFSSMVNAPYATAQFTGTLVVEPDKTNSRHVNLTITMSSPTQADMRFAKIGVMHDGDYVMLKYDESSGLWSNYTEGKRWHYEAKIVDMNGNEKIDTGDELYVYVVDDNRGDGVSAPPFHTGDKIVLSISGYNGNAEAYLDV